MGHNYDMAPLRSGLFAIAIILSPIWLQDGWANQEDDRLDALFSQLQSANSGRTAKIVEQLIWKIWLQSGDETLDQLMATGVKAMGTGNYNRALAAFNAILEDAPNFAEGWNKRATLYWLMGDFEKSISDIDQTLALEPRHFGALSGLAMIRESQHRPLDAIQAFKQVLEIYPAIPNAGQRIRELSRQLGEPI